MTTKNEAEKAIELLTEVNRLLSPSVVDHDDCMIMQREMKREGESDITICKAITAMIYDGLAYGNWPSATRAMRQRTKTK